MASPSPGIIKMPDIVLDEHRGTDERRTSDRTGVRSSLSPRPVANAAPPARVCARACWPGRASARAAVQRANTLRSSRAGAPSARRT